MNTFSKFLVAACFALVVPVSAVDVFAADDKPAEEKGSAMKVEARKKLPTVTFTFSKGTEWKTNYPTLLFPAEERKGLKGLSKKNAKVVQTNRGIRVEKTEDGATQDFPITDVVKMEWPTDDPRLATAQDELNRGNPSGALAVAETFLKFFENLKSVEGSPWIKAAVIKLDALDQQENDASLTDFIREIESTSGYRDIPGLTQKIELARLNQLIRKGENSSVLTASDKMIGETLDTEALARLHLIKGNALYNLARYEEALNTYLRIPVFYGYQDNFVPPAKLAIARCLKRMDRPETKSMKLNERSEEYLMEIIQKYPMSLEAKNALAELPQYKREEAQAKASIEEQAAARAAVTSQLETADSDDDDSSSSDDSSSDE